jgi:predicted ribosome quality control (RQC) complex YloA/Tae2 family protein
LASPYIHYAICFLISSMCVIFFTMDNIILEALLDEWNKTLPGAGIAKIYYYIDDGYYLALFNNSSRILHFALSGHAMGCRILNDRPTKPSETGRFMLLLRKYIEGAYIKELSKPSYERMLEIKLVKSKDGILVTYLLILEFTGKNTNAFLLSGDGKILALERPVKSAKRVLDLNMFYTPPPAPAPVNLDNLAKEDLQRFADKARDTDTKLEVILASSIFGLGSIFALELAMELRKSVQHAWNLMVKIRKARNEKYYSPGLYLPSDPRITSMHKPLCHVITPLEQAKGMKLVNYNSVSSCLSAAYIEFQNRSRLISLRERLTEKLAKERKALEGLIKNIQKDLSKFSNPEEYKNWGELLVANLATAVKSGDTVEVADIYQSEQPKITIKIDPAISLQANADRFFNLFRKSKRGKEIVERKISQSNERLNSLIDVMNKISSSKDEDLEMLEREMLDSGFIKAQMTVVNHNKTERRLPYRSFVSSEGMDIMIGRKSSDNDILTFKYANDSDFWLHCAGTAGSHTVIRNPKKLTKCPGITLEEAASLAAFFSKQRSNSKVQVNYTQRKYVRKMKDAPPGQVKLLSYSSLLVKPEIPVGVTGGDEDKT